MRNESLCLAVAACVLATGGAAAAEDASRWDGDVRSAARLIAGLPAATGELRAGIAIRLKAGWHTYWRYPGDAGVPPQLDFKGSQNVKQVQVKYPAPRRLPEAGGIAIGYVDDLILPVQVEPQDAKKPVKLRLKLDYAICEKLCVPAQANLELALGKGPASQEAALAAAEARVPKKAKLGEDGPLVIRSFKREQGPARPRIVVDVGAEGPVDLFAEGPTPQWALPLPMPIDGAPAGARRFTFELDGLPSEGSDRGAVLTLTATSPGHAIEVAIRLD